MIKKRNILAFALTAVLVFTGCVHTAMSAEKERIINELIDASNAKGFMNEMANDMSTAIIAHIKRSNKNVTKKQISIFEDELNIMFEELTNDPELDQVIAKTYSKHYTQAEIEELLAFYKTPLGQKVARITPKVSKDMMKNAQPVIEKKTNEAVSRVTMRLIEDAIKNKK